MRRVALGLVLLASVVPVHALAHPLAPAVLSLMPGPEADTVIMTWRAPVTRPKGQALTPRIPEGCRAVGPTRREFVESDTAVIDTTILRCEPPTLVGATIRVDGLHDSTVNVVVRIGRPDGAVSHGIIDTRAPSFLVEAPEEAQSSFTSYLGLGIMHLVTGWDHLTFVLGLLVLFGWHRRLIAAVTAFTLGHSLTLALSVLGIVTVPQALVEALIAMTIVVLALEIQSSGRGPIWRHPWALPATLGLLHGLGFASVLFEAGLPPGEIPLALFGFNVGLEVGQLGVIAVAWLAYRAARGSIPAAWQDNRAIPGYLIGSIAAYWVIERMLAAFGWVA
ncbi:MAG: HupE/UreJ family protein [Polyangiales bacterium]